jgi:hypothetical protein
MAFAFGRGRFERWKSGEGLSTRDYHLYLGLRDRVLVPARDVLHVLNEGFAILVPPLDLALFVCADGARKRCVA